MVFRPQGDIRGYRGRQETGRFYWRFLFCSGKPEGKNGSEGERSNPLSYAGSKRGRRDVPLFTPFCTPRQYNYLRGVFADTTIVYGDTPAVLNALIR